MVVRPSEDDAEHPIGLQGHCQIPILIWNTLVVYRFDIFGSYRIIRMCKNSIGWDSRNNL